MSAIAGEQDAREQQRDDVTRRGLAIYEEQLRKTVERQHLGKVVAIHVDTGDYVVAEESPDAMRAMMARHPEGQMFIRRIGPPTASDLRLATRVVAAEVIHGK